MPTYDYRCEATGQTYEVKHAMSEKLACWGELAERLGLPLGGVPADAAVVRLATGGNVVNAGALKNSGASACPMAGCMGNGMCGMQN